MLDLLFVFSTLRNGVGQMSRSKDGGYCPFCGGILHLRDDDWGKGWSCESSIGLCHLGVVVPFRKD
jgi:hypothetical protein